MITEKLRQRIGTLKSTATRLNVDLDEAQKVLDLSQTLSPLEVKTDIYGTSSVSDSICAVSFTYPNVFIRSQASRDGSQLWAHPSNPDSVIALTCMQKLPRPPVSSENIEAITVDGVAATLYHDKTESGALRDEVIIKHPTTKLELILAAPPEILQTILPTFRFLQ